MRQPLLLLLSFFLLLGPPSSVDHVTKHDLTRRGAPLERDIPWRDLTRHAREAGCTPASSDWLRGRETRG